MNKNIIKDFKRDLDLRFEDPFVVKQDRTNQVVTRYRWWVKKLYRRLWYD